MRRRVGRIVGPFRFAQCLASWPPVLLLDGEIDVGVRVRFPALALEYPAGLAAPACIALRSSGTVVEVQQKLRGTYLTVGSPIKFSDFTPEITGSPLLGEHTDEVLAGLGYSPDQITKLREAKVV
jgi:crotonobetainyl-CoA:carnitine CoA-transferase CaiB-like acyl-CoA transferase